MTPLSRNERLFLSSLSLVVLVLFVVIGALPVMGSPTLRMVTRLILHDDGEPLNPDQAAAQEALINVGGPSQAGDGVQLQDMTAHYQKTDLVINNSVGAFAITRMYTSSGGTWLPPKNQFSPGQQWTNNYSGSVSFFWHNVITCDPAPPNCVTGPSFRVRDPLSGTILEYMNRQGIDRPISSGFQPQVSGYNPARLYVDGVLPDGGAQRYILFEPGVKYYFESANSYQLSSIEDVRYASAGTINLATMSYSSAGVSIVTADGVQLIVAMDGGQPQSISIAGSDAGPVVLYTYNSTGMLSGVSYPETGDGETYDYGVNGSKFTVTTAAGRQVVSYAVDAGEAAGNGAASSETDEDRVLALLGWYKDYSHVLTDSSVSQGDGFHNPTTLTTTFVINEGSAQTTGMTINCASCSALLPSPEAVWAFYPGANGGLAGFPSPPIAAFANNENNSFMVYLDAGLASNATVPAIDAGFAPPAEYPIILLGANNSSGSDAGQVIQRSYVYGGLGQSPRGYEQFISKVTRGSPLGGLQQTLYMRDQTKNQLNAVVRTGQMATDSSFALSARAVGTLYKYDTTGPLAHLIEVDGPCYVTAQIQANPNQAPTTCESPGLAPKIVYTYWASGNGFNSNRIATKTVSVCTGFATCSTSLVTRYDAYDARGHVLSSTDPNGVVTTSSYQGNRLTTRQVGTDRTTYGYDGDQLQWILHPSGMVDFSCHRNSGSTSSCTGTLSKNVYWKARCQDTGCLTKTEQVVYQYLHGQRIKETYYDGTGQQRRVIRHDFDPRGRPTFDATGDIETTYVTRRMFDNSNNQIGNGDPYNAPSVACSKGADTTSCAGLAYDGMNRLTQLIEPDPSGFGGKSLFTYDSLGHVATISYGCNASNSGCRVVQYTYDDFGNLLSVNAPWAVGLIRYASDAQGHTIYKHTPVMAAGEVLQYDYDTLGRAIDLKHLPAGETLWALDYDAANTSGGGCPTPGSASFTMGRIQVRHDSFGQTWYAYNFRGQITEEVRVRAGSSGCVHASATVPSSPSCQGSGDEVHLNTVYSYNATTGVVNAMQYPHGRIVRFTYGSGGDSERVSTVSADLLAGSTCATTLLINNVAWEPYSGIRGYEVDAPIAVSSAKAAVEYLLGSNGPVGTLCPVGSRSLDVNSDHSGRVNSLWVSTGTYPSPTGSGDIFGRQYNWKGNLLTAQATCLLGAGPSVQTFGSSTVPGYDARLRLQHVSRPTGAGSMRTTGGAFGRRDYTYDYSSNRTSEATDCWNWTDSYSGDQLGARFVTGSACSQACTGYSYLYTGYQYDADGKLSQLSTPTASGVQPWNLFFGNTIDGQAALDGVYKSVTVNGAATYEYYYDGSGRRRAKMYPLNDQMDEYFYGLTNLMLEDHEAGTLNDLDEYVWLGNRPVVLLRGSLNSSGVRNSDFGGVCADSGVCGAYFPIADYLGKPVLLLDSSLRVAGAADYDPFGHINRVTAIGETSHPYAAAPKTQVIAGFRQTVPSGASYGIIARARLAMVDTDSASAAAASLTDLWANPLPRVGGGLTRSVGGPTLGAAWTDWAVIPDNSSSFPGQFQVRFTAATGTASGRAGLSVAGYEFRQYQIGATATWLPLRFPGHYYDAETDLFQNWNRFYDPQTGRYLAPEPKWVSPEFVIQKAGGTPAVYAYANNNPVNFVDPDGLEELASDSDLTQEDQDAILASQQAGLQAAVDSTAGQLVIAAVEGMATGVFMAFGGEILMGVAEGLDAAFGATATAETATAAAGADATTIATTATKGMAQDALNLQKSLASEAQMAEKGEAFAGSGTGTVFRDAERLASTYGGQAGDWVKVTSSNFTAADGASFEVHSCRNIETGLQVEFKTVLSN